MAPSYRLPSRRSSPLRPSQHHAFRRIAAARPQPNRRRATARHSTSPQPRPSPTRPFHKRLSECGGKPPLCHSPNLPPSVVSPVAPRSAYGTLALAFRRIAAARPPAEPPPCHPMPINPAAASALHHRRPPRTIPSGRHFKRGSILLRFSLPFLVTMCYHASGINRRPSPNAHATRPPHSRRRTHQPRHHADSRLESPAPFDTPCHF
jgi:hypothetical protein